MELRDLGARVRLHARDGDDLGVVHAPAPIEPGDLVAPAAGPAFVVTALVVLDATDALDPLAEVEPLRV